LGRSYTDEGNTVVGAAESQSRTVNIRNRDDPATQAKGELVPLDVAITKLTHLKENRALVNALEKSG
jgi:threonyl-tRNA synthetase